MATKLPIDFGHTQIRFACGGMCSLCQCRSLLSARESQWTEPATVHPRGGSIRLKQLLSSNS
jgi:hypothetical protein